MTTKADPGLIVGWFDYVHRSRGPREQRKALELGEPAAALAAHQAVDDVVRDVGGTEALALVLALLDAAESEADLVAVAAGPLESLMHGHGSDVIDQIETQARKGGPIRTALTSVHLSADQEARLRPWMR